jgi:hypothetical protein
MATRKTEERSYGADGAFKVCTVLCAVLDWRRGFIAKRMDDGRDRDWARGENAGQRHGAARVWVTRPRLH